MESAFTGLVRKHGVPFKKKQKTSRIITIALQHHHSLCWFLCLFGCYPPALSLSLSLSLSLFLSLSLCLPHSLVPAARSVLALCRCHGHKRMTERGVINEN